MNNLKFLAFIPLAFIVLIFVFIFAWVGVALAGPFGMFVGAAAGFGIGYKAVRELWQKRNNKLAKDTVRAYFPASIKNLHEARQDVRQWAVAGSVKSVKLRTCQDEMVCDTCRKMDSKVFPFQTPEDINFVMDNAKVRTCTNKVCRCQWHPEDISL